MVFAGAEPIEEENLGDMFEVQGDDPLPHTPPPAAAMPDTPEPPPAPPVQGEPPSQASATPEGEGVPPQQEQPPADPAAEPPADSQGATPPAAEVQPEGDQPPPDATIPPFRLAQEAARRRKAEADLAEMQRRQYEAAQAAQQQQPPPAAPQPPNVPPQQQELDLDFGATPQEMFNKVLDGDMEKATELFQSMMKQTAEKTVQAIPHQQDVSPSMTADQIQHQINARVEAQKDLDAESNVIDSLEKQYPQLNPQSENFDAGLVEEALSLQSAYIQQHYTRADAMERAVAAALNINGITPAQVSPAGLGAGQPATDQATVKRNLDAAAATPPQMPSGTSANPLDIDVTTLTTDDLDGLPEATLARLRGDIL